MPSEQFVALACTGTNVRVQEVGNGAPVLFIHGGPNCGSTWAPVVQYLDGFRCLLVDRPGTGLSDHYPVTADNLPNFGARFVGDVLDGLGLDQAHVVGSSFGGHLALRSAAADPNRIDRMVQMAAPALLPGDHLPPFMKWLARGWVRRILNILPPSERASRNIFRQIGHGHSLDRGVIPETFLGWYMDLQRHTDTMKNDGNMIADVVIAYDQVGLTDTLLNSVPTSSLFIWGEDDGFGGEDLACHVVEAMPAAELVMVEHAGHLPWLDNPKRVADLCADFLSRS